MDSDRNPLAKQEADDEQAGSKLGKNGSSRGAGHPHMEGEDKYRVQNQIGHGSNQDGNHSYGAKTLTGNKIIQTDRHQGKKSACGIDRQIGVCVRKGRFACAEPPQKLFFAKKKGGGKKGREGHEHQEAVREHLTGFLHFFLAHFHRHQNGTSKAD